MKQKNKEESFISDQISEMITSQQGHELLANNKAVEFILLLIQENIPSHDIMAFVSFYLSPECSFPKSPRLVMQFLINPKYTELIREGLQLQKLEIGEGGISIDDWSTFTKGLFDTLVNTENAQKTDPLWLGLKKESREQFKKPIKEIYCSELFDPEAWQFYKRLNRTVIFKSKESDIYRAFKIGVSSDPYGTQLRKQFAAVKYLSKQRHIPHASKIPTPIEVALVRGLEDLTSILTREEKLKLEEVIGNDYSYGNLVYVYETTDPNYFCYAHESQETLFSSLCLSTSDLFSYLRSGIIYDSIAKFLHNTDKENMRDDLGHFLTLANLVAFNANVEPSGTGRFHAWIPATDDHDLRLTGLADEGDYVGLLELRHRIANNVHLHLKVTCEKFEYDKNKTETALLMNFMAEYLLVLELIIGHATKDAKRWQRASSMLAFLYARAFSQYTKMPEDICYAFWNIAMNQTRYARQMECWMSDEHLAYIPKKQLPLDVYGENVDVSFIGFRENTYHENLGFSQDGVNRDLGAANGQYPIKEGDKSRYVFAVFAILYRKVMKDSVENCEAVQQYLKRTRQITSLVSNVLRKTKQKKNHALLFLVNDLEVRSNNLTKNYLLTTRQLINKYRVFFTDRELADIETILKETQITPNVQKIKEAQNLLPFLTVLSRMMLEFNCANDEEKVTISARYLQRAWRERRHEKQVIQFEASSKKEEFHLSPTLGRGEYK